MPQRLRLRLRRWAVGADGSNPHRGPEAGSGASCADPPFLACLPVCTWMCQPWALTCMLQRRHMTSRAPVGRIHPGVGLSAADGIMLSRALFDRDSKSIAIAFTLVPLTLWISYSK